MLQMPEDISVDEEFIQALPVENRVPRGWNFGMMTVSKLGKYLTNLSKSSSENRDALCLM